MSEDPPTEVVVPPLSPDRFSLGDAGGRTSSQSSPKRVTTPQSKSSSGRAGFSIRSTGDSDHDRMSVGSSLTRYSRPLSVPEMISLGAPGAGCLVVLEEPDLKAVSSISDQKPVHSGITIREKARVAVAGFGTSCVAATLLGQQNLYISLFGGDTALIGIISILIVVYDLWNGPFFGRLGDEGYFNKFCFSDREHWGRRAPLAFLAVPVGMVAFLANFVGAESMSPIFVALWYGLVRFLMATAFSAYYSASGSAISELFPTQEERVGVLTARCCLQAVGTLFGAGVLAPVALAQDKAGSSQQRVVFLGLGGFTAVLWLLVVPWAYLQRRTVVKKQEERHGSLVGVCTEVFQAVPVFRAFCIGEHLMGAVLTTFVMLLPFYFQHVLEFERSEVANGTAIFVGTVAVSGIAGAPITGVLTRYVTPSVAIGGICLVMGILLAGGFSLAWTVREEFLKASIFMSVVTGLWGGLTGAAFTLVRAVILSWVADLDHVNRAKAAGCLPSDESGFCSPTRHVEIPARRDGLFQAISSAFSISGAAWTGVVSIGLGRLGYESDRDDMDPPQPQPELVQTAIFITVCIVQPIIFISYAWIMLRFPLRGERLKKLEEDYKILFASMQEEERQKAAWVLSDVPVVPVHSPEGEMASEANGSSSIVACSEERRSEEHRSEEPQRPSQPSDRCSIQSCSALP